MRKLKKPTAKTEFEKPTESSSSSSNLNLLNFGQDTLLTIPPLLLGNEDLKNTNFLMSFESSETKIVEQNDGKICFSASLMEKQDLESNDQLKNLNKVKKRKHNNNSDDESENESSNQGFTFKSNRFDVDDSDDEDDDDESDDENSDSDEDQDDEG